MIRCYIKSERTRILVIMLIGTLIGAIPIFWKGFDRPIKNINEIESPRGLSIPSPTHLVPSSSHLSSSENHIKEEYSVFPTESSIDDNDDLSSMIFKRVVAIIYENKEPTIIDNAYYNINLSFNPEIAQATVDVKINIGGINSNNISIFLSKETIKDASYYNSYIRALPFCFYRKNNSKPPIFLLSDYWNYSDWVELKKDLAEKKELVLDSIDAVDIIRPQPNVKFLSNSCEMYGNIHISQENNTIQINSESEGVVDISYKKANLLNQEEQEISIVGFINRNYTILAGVENPCLIKEMSYETISDTTMAFSGIPSLHQTIIEKIQKVD